MTNLDRALTAGTVCMLAIGLTAATATLRGPRAIGSGAKLPLGDRAPAPLVTQGQWTVTLLLSPDCRFCVESMPTYRDVLSNRRDVPVTVAGSHSPEALRAFAAGHDFRADRFESLPVEALPVRMTPAMLLVDPTGIIRGVWTGRPSENARRSMVNALADATRQNGSAQGIRGPNGAK